MIELERRYLLKRLPQDLHDWPSTEVYDIYIPKDAAHAYLRVRKNGERMVITKKTPVEGDTNKLKEETIVLSEEEFTVLKELPGKVLHKIRYFYEHDSHTIEIGVFQGALKGLVLADVEFENEEDMKAFKMPDFFLCEVHDEEFAGGWLCGKNIDDIQEALKRHQYQELS